MIRTLIIQLAIGILFVAVCGVLVFLSYTYIESLRLRATTLAQELVVKSEEVLHGVDGQDLQSALVKEEENIHSRFTSEEGVVSYIEEVEQVAKAGGAVLTVSSVDVREGDFPRLVITFRMSGTYTALLQFLSYLDYGPYDTSVEGVVFEKQEQGWSVTGTFTTSMLK